MKNIYPVIIAFIASFSFQSCRVNNGDIGDLFGSWLVYDMTVDGTTPADFNPALTYFEFQNNILFITRVDDRYDKYLNVATWTRHDDILSLNFTHSDKNQPAGTGSYAAPEWLLMPSDTILDLHIFNPSSSHMTLSFTDLQGRIITYQLRKIW